MALDGKNVATIAIIGALMICFMGYGIYDKYRKVKIPKDIRDKGYKEIPKGFFINQC